MHISYIKHVIAAAAIALPTIAAAQAMYFNSASVVAPIDPEAYNGYPNSFIEALTNPVDSVRTIEELYAALEAAEAPTDTLVVMRQLPATFFGPAVYEGFEFADTTNTLFTPDFSGNPALRWIEEESAMARNIKSMQRALFFGNPRSVHYNINLLPEAPKVFHAVVNPEDHTIEIVENLPVAVAPTIAAAEVQKRHWIRAFSGLLQFSQAYVSPNWYQGGNNNLNILADVRYNVKLNQEYHPNLLFETNASWKLGVNSAPDDEYRGYSISDDLLQLTSTFGIKAAKKWYYSLTGVFKTQVVNAFKSNSNDLVSSFLSPGDLTIGLGMTYNYANEKKTVTFDASIAPVSYNMKTCISKRIDETIYGIDPGKHFVQHFGSSAELKFFWKISSNISYTTRVFAFTDYSSVQVDWENRVLFDINRFLSTQVYCNLRYDSSAPIDVNWKRLQLKEILSIGFSYKFSSI